MFSLPYVLAYVSIASLVASLYKDWKLDGDTLEKRRTLSIYHLAQLAVVVVALWAAVDIILITLRGFPSVDSAKSLSRSLMRSRLVICSP